MNSGDAVTDDTQPPPSSPGDVGQTERNGSVTGIGITLGFSLTFITGWSSGPTPWTGKGLLMLAVMLIGVGFQFAALARIIRLPRGTIRQHGVAMTMFFTGIILIFLGFGLGVMFDVIDLAAKGKLHWTAPDPSQQSSPATSPQR